MLFRLHDSLFASDFFRESIPHRKSDEDEVRRLRFAEVWAWSLLRFGIGMAVMGLDLVVMAAGMGSRFGGLKQVEGFGPTGETLLEYSLFDAIEGGFDRFVFVIRRDIENTFRDKVISKFRHHVECVCVYQELDDLPSGFCVPEGRLKPWGTGHAVLAARSVVRNCFGVINADDAYGRDAFIRVGSFLKGLDAEASVCAMAGYRLGNTLSANGTVSRGLCETDEEGNLLAVTEHTALRLLDDGTIVSDEEAGVSLECDAFVSMNFWGFAHSFMAILMERFEAFLSDRGDEEKSEFYLPSAVDHAVRSGRLKAKVVPTDACWFGVTYPDDREPVRQAVSRLVETGIYPSPLWR